MKRIALIVLIVFFGLSQSVQGVHFHFCSNQLAAVDFINLGDEPAKACGACSKAKSCCSDVVQILEHEAFHHSIPAVAVKAPLALPELPSYSFPYNRSATEVNASVSTAGPVSDGDIPIYIRHRQFRL